MLYQNKTLYNNELNKLFYSVIYKMIAKIFTFIQYGLLTRKRGNVCSEFKQYYIINFTRILETRK